jgi:hypothetical protein
VLLNITEMFVKSMLRTVEQERKDRRTTEIAVLAKIRLSKATWKKEHQQEIAQLEKRIEVCYELMAVPHAHVDCSVSWCF